MSESEHQSDEEKDFEKLLEESSLGSPIVKEIIKQGEALQSDMYKRTVVDIFLPGKPPRIEKKPPKK